MNSDLKIIKKYYGEKMMHLCREHFPTILEHQGELPKILTDNFAKDIFLYENIEKDKKYLKSFINFVFSRCEENQGKSSLVNTGKTVSELFAEKGYDFFECKTEEDIQNFKKYYQEDEELCTFNQGRLQDCYVFWAVKKNVNQIKRENFTDPKREDEYGTSVMSIQYTRIPPHILSIKNRYNHTVSNPDATYSNNLENINPGLTKAMEQDYHMFQANIDNGFDIPGYVNSNENKFYYYNYEENNIYYCPNNVIIDNFQAKKYDKEKYIVMDGFILDLVGKKIEAYDKDNNDSFPGTIKNIEKINVTKNKKERTKRIEIKTKDSDELIIIELNEKNQIIAYTNPIVTEIKSDFLNRCKTLEKLSLSNVKKVGIRFVQQNEILDSVFMPKLEEAGDFFFENNLGLKEISFAKLKTLGNCSFQKNEQAKIISMPEVEYIADSCFETCIHAEGICFPKLRKVGDFFFMYNQDIHTAILPNLEKAGSNFLRCNKKLREIDLKNVIYLGDYFLEENEILEKINIINVITLNSCSLSRNKGLKSLRLDNAIQIGNFCLRENENISELYAPKVTSIGIYTLEKNSYYKTLHKSAFLRNVKNKIANELTNLSHSQKRTK